MNDGDFGVRHVASRAVGARPAGWLGRSLRLKILALTGLPVLLTLGSMLGYTLWRLRVELVRVGIHRIEAELRAVASEVGRANRECLTMARSIAAMQREGMFGKRAETLSLLHAVLAANPQFTGAYVGYEPNADGQDASSLGQKGIDPKSMDATGRFIPYWVRDVSDDSLIRLEPLVNMESSYYYAGLKNRVAGHSESADLDPEQLKSNSRSWTPERETAVRDDPSSGHITEPYIYEGKLIIEQTAPIVLGGKFVGIAGIDRALGALEQFVFDLRPYETAEVTLISRRGRVVATTLDRDVDAAGLSAERIQERTLKSDRVEDTPLAELLVPLYERDADLAPGRQQDPITGEAIFVGVRKVEPGGWTVVLTVREQEILAPIQAILWRSAGLGVLGLALFAVLLAITSGRIAARIRRAGHVVRQVADGDLSLEVRADSQDEAGQLLDDLGGMVHDLHALVGAVRESEQELKTTAQTLECTTRQQEDVVRGINTSVAETSAAVTEISATARELNRTTEGVADQVVATAQQASEGRDRLESIDRALRGLADAAQKISERFGEIHRRSETIGRVVTTISNLAHQTNMLSLNAAILAEKAGDAGHGFTVIAREIRRLADQTEISTQDIQRIVDEMQRAVSAGVMSMEKFLKDVDLEVEETVEVGHQFAAILDQVEALTPRFQQIRAGMLAQGEAAAQIGARMGELSHVTHGATDSIAATKKATAGMIQSVENLKTKVDRFRL